MSKIVAVNIASQIKVNSIKFVIIIIETPMTTAINIKLIAKVEIDLFLRHQNLTKLSVF